MSTIPKVKQSLIEKYYQVVRSAYNIYAIDKQNMGFAEFQKMHKVASVAMTYLLNKCVVRYMEDGERKYKWNIMVKPSIEIAQEMANRSRNYNRELAKKKQPKIASSAQGLIDKDSKQSYIESQYPLFRKVKNKAGGFGMLTSKLKISFDNIGFKLADNISYKDVARLFFKEDKINLKTVFEDVKKYSPRYKTKTVKIYDKGEVITKVLDDTIKQSKPMPVDQLPSFKNKNKVQLNTDQLEYNKRIVDNKTDIEDNYELIKTLTSQINTLNLDSNTVRTLYSHMKDEVSDLKDILKDVSVETAINIDNINKTKDDNFLKTEKIPYIYQFIMGTGFIYSLYLFDKIINHILLIG